MVAPAGGGGGVVEILIVDQPQFQAAARILPEEEFEVEAGVEGAEVDRLDLEPVEGLRILGEGILKDLCILEDQGHLKKRIAPQIALRRQGLDQLLEGQILVGIGPQGDLAQSLHQLGEGGAPAEVAAQHQGVDEEADQPLDLRPIAVGDRRAEHDVALTAERREAAHPSRQEGHEERGPGIEAEAPQTVDQLGLEGRPEDAPGIGLERRSRPVGGQFELADPVQAAPPRLDLGVEHVALEPLPLPGGEVGVLHRQGGQVGGLDLAVGGVERRQVAQQHAARPAVRNDVVEMEKEEILAVPSIAEPQQEHPDERSAPQVEDMHRLVTRRPPRLALPRRRLEGAEVEPRQADRHSRVDDLHRLPVDIGEAGAQTLLAPRQGGQGAGQAGRVESAVHGRPSTRVRIGAGTTAAAGRRRPARGAARRRRGAGARPSAAPCRGRRRPSPGALGGRRAGGPSDARKARAPPGRGRSPGAAARPPGWPAGSGRRDGRNAPARRGRRGRRVPALRRSIDRPCLRGVSGARRVRRRHRHRSRLARSDASPGRGGRPCRSASAAGRRGR